MEISENSNNSDDHHHNNEEDDHVVPSIPMLQIVSNPTLLDEDEDQQHPLVLSLSASPLPPITHNVQEMYGNRQNAEQLEVSTTQNEGNDYPTLDFGVPRWPTDRPGKIQPMCVLLQNQITLIYGNVQCNNCDNISKRFYHILDDFREVAMFVLARPEVVEPWNNNNNVRVSMCARCEQEVGCKPVIPENSGEIDWLFLLLGQFIEYCTDSQLHDYCNRNNIQFEELNGASDFRARRIHATYWTLCHQLDPCGLFKTSYLTM